MVFKIKPITQIDETYTAKVNAESELSRDAET